MRSRILLFTLSALCSLGSYAQCPGQAKLMEVRSSVKTALKIYNDPAEKALLRRTAFRALLSDRRRSAAVIRKALSDKDVVIRSRAIYESHIRNKDQGYAVLRNAIKDSNEQVAKLVLNCAKALKDNKRSVELLKLIAKSSKLPMIRREAIRIVDFPYHKEVKLLRNDPTHDQEVVTVKSLPLAMDGWMFQTDKTEDGHHKGYFNVNFNDTKWHRHKIGAWEGQGFPNYDGVAWYRFKFKVGKKVPDINAVEIHFGAVDEVAWVWLNGKYVGQNDQGTKGWDRPFDLDITREIQYDAENVLVVRVYDTIGAGGIWKPVKINFLK